jgi:hypothetical protein
MSDIPLDTFVPFNKMPRLNRSCIVTEKIDGSNGCVVVLPDGTVKAGSRTRWVTPAQDNYGFAAWVLEHEAELRGLGVGRHFGEWWGRGINRGYGLEDRRFSLFNVSRWHQDIWESDEQLRYQRELAEVARLMKLPDIEMIPFGKAPSPRRYVAPPACCSVVPVVWRGQFSSATVNGVCLHLAKTGSVAAPGYTNPEGVVCFMEASQHLYKVLIDNDHQPKGIKPL